MDSSLNRLNPFPVYEEMRDHHPVVRDPRTGVWSIYRYDDVETALSDYRQFRSGSGEPNRLHMGPGASIIGMNPPDHRKMRDIISRAFTPRAVEQLSARIEGIVEDLLDAVIPQGSLDIVEDLAYPLPVIVIAEMLGIAAEDRADFKRWSDLVVSGTDNHAMGHEGIESMNAYFLAIVRERRLHLGDDLISALIEAEVNGEQLTDAEIVSFCDLLLVAGNETTTNLLTNTIWTMIDYPDVWGQLVKSPELLPQAIEEVLRFRSPVQAMFRHTVGEVQFPDGTRIEPDATVVAWIGSANRDPRKFPHADTFDLWRSPNQNIAFGHGIHYCLGAPLARLETRIALTGLLSRRISGFESQIPPEQYEPVGGFIVHGLKRLPVSVFG